MTFPRQIRMEDASSTISEYVRRHGEALRVQVKTHGAVLLRGWPFDAHEFARLARLFGEPLGRITCSAGPRLEVIEGVVFTANEAPPSESIPFHHEMAQCPTPPEFVLFACETPPARGGATPLIRSSRMAAELWRAYPKVAQRLRDRKIRYVRELPAETDMTSPLGKSWRDTLGATTRAEAERTLHAQGFEWEWLANDRLKTIGPVVAIFVERHGEETLFTAAETVFLEEVRPGRPEKSFIYGDKTPLDAEARAALLALGRFAFDESVRVPWMRGDVLIVDNATVMHARDPFVSPRRILVSLIGCLE